jgi:hypothetical protein
MEHDNLALIFRQATQDLLHPPEAFYRVRRSAPIRAFYSVRCGAPFAVFEEGVFFKGTHHHVPFMPCSAVVSQRNVPRYPPQV